MEHTTMETQVNEPLRVAKPPIVANDKSNRRMSLSSPFSPPEPKRLTSDDGLPHRPKSAQYWRDGRPREDIHAQVRNARRYFCAIRALYEIQRDASRFLKPVCLRAHPYKFKFHTKRTADSIHSLLSPLRTRHVIDDWSALEISLFEEAFAHCGKEFHLIKKYLPDKSVKDIVAFYYIWKPYQRHSRDETRESPSSSTSPSPSPSSSSSSSAGTTTPNGGRKKNRQQQHQAQDSAWQQQQRVQKAKHRAMFMREYFESIRVLNASRRARTQTPLRLSNPFGLKAHGFFLPFTNSNSSLRTPMAIDTWTPHEIMVFEAAIEYYGKDFYQITNVVGTKSCRQVIAFYYIWKKQHCYQQMKTLWKAKRDQDPTKHKPVG